MDAHCDFIKNDEGKWQCKTCHWVYPLFTEKSLTKRCSAKLTPEIKAQREAARAEQEKLAATGPGTQLHKLITKFTGEKITARCGCKSHIAEMNRNGPAWCRENVDTIVGWMEEEIDKRLKVATIAANDVVRLTKEYEAAKERRRTSTIDDADVFAIGKQLTEAEEAAKPGWRLKLAGYNLPGQRLAIKRMILLACTLAERMERSSATLH